MSLPRGRMISDPPTGTDRDVGGGRVSAYFGSSGPPPPPRTDPEESRPPYSYYDGHSHGGSRPHPTVAYAPPIQRTPSSEQPAEYGGEYRPGYDPYAGPYAGRAIRSYSYDSKGSSIPVTAQEGSTERMYASRGHSGSFDHALRTSAQRFHGPPPSPASRQGSGQPPGPPHYEYGPIETHPLRHRAPYVHEPGPPPRAGPPPYDPRRPPNSSPPGHPTEQGGPEHYAPLMGPDEFYAKGHHMSTEMIPSHSWKKPHSMPHPHVPPHHALPHAVSYPGSNPKIPIKKMQLPRGPRQKADSPGQLEAFRRLDVLAAGCTCKKSKCLKLYCFCFSADVHCTSNCRCLSCCNNASHEKVRQRARSLILSRNPTAFTSKFQAKGDAKLARSKVVPSAKLAHKVGCKCRRSYCLKKYCECYNAGIKCNANCRCERCKNQGPPSEPKDAPRRAPVMVRPMGAGAVRRPTSREFWMMDAAQNLTFMKSSPSPKKPTGLQIHRGPPMAGRPPAPMMISSESTPTGRSPEQIKAAPASRPDDTPAGSAKELLLAAMAMTALHKESPAKSSTTQSRCSSLGEGAEVHANSVSIERTTEPLLSNSAVAETEARPIKKRRVAREIENRVADGLPPLPPTPTGNLIQTSASRFSPTSRVSADEGDDGTASVPTSTMIQSMNSSSTGSDSSPSYLDIRQVAAIKTDGKDDRKRNGGTVETESSTTAELADNSHVEVLAR